MFIKIDPPTYKFSHIDTTRNIKRKGCDGLYLAYNGFCFVQYDADGPVVPYTFTERDITATFTNLLHSVAGKQTSY